MQMRYFVSTPRQREGGASKRRDLNTWRADWDEEGKLQNYAKGMKGRPVRLKRAAVKPYRQLLLWDHRLQQHTLLWR